LGKLDYGNAPRATPLIHEDLVITLGAFGHLSCIELETGILLWNRNIAADFGAAELTWGHAASPLIAGEHLIVQPGGPDAAVVALDPDTGEDVWTAPGAPASYSSFITLQTTAGEQILGLDALSLGGWDVKTGQRRWKLVPPVSGDFNVPTPVLVGGRLLAVSENNGARLYEFGTDGQLQPQPVFQNPDLKPDSHTPVVSGGRIYGVCNELLELDPADQLKTRSTLSDDAFTDYCSLIASDSRLLILSSSAELLLVSTDTPVPRILAKLKLSSERIQTLSHPAVASGSLYVRLNRTLARMKLR
jgi:outer membrane protein assembly factor BamB